MSDELTLESVVKYTCGASYAISPENSDGTYTCNVGGAFDFTPFECKEEMAEVKGYCCVICCRSQKIEMNTKQFCLFTKYILSKLFNTVILGCINV